MLNIRFVFGMCVRVCCRTCMHAHARACVCTCVCMYVCVRACVRARVCGVCAVCVTTSKFKLTHIRRYSGSYFQLVCLLLVEESGCSVL